MNRLMYIDSILHWTITKDGNEIKAQCPRIATEVVANSYPDLNAAMNKAISSLFNELYDTSKLAKYVHDHGLAIRVMDFPEKQISCVPAPIVIEQKEEK